MICHDCGQQLEPDEAEVLITYCVNCLLEPIFEAEYHAEHAWKVGAEDREPVPVACDVHKAPACQTLILALDVTVS
jgi:hypothetical protein